MPRALITGITGQDGYYLSRLLMGQGYEVHGWSREECDITQPDTLRVAIQQAQPDEIYHLAAQSHVGESADAAEQTMTVNHHGTVALLETAAREMPNAKIFFASSSEIFGRPEIVPQDETTPLAPVNPYGESKAAATEAVRAARNSSTFAVNGILYNHESPRRGSNFVTQKICQAAAAIARGEQSELTLGDTFAARDWSDARDIVRGMHLALQADTPEDFIFASGQTHTVQDVIDIAFATANLDWRDHVKIDQSLFRAAEPRQLIGNPAKARAMLDWEAENSFHDLITEMTKVGLPKE